MPKSPKPPKDPVVDPDEQWIPMQVAAFMGLTYQDARNAMLEGDFGEPAYDAKTRKLTVLAARVRAVKAKRRAKRSRRKRTRGSSRRPGE